MLKAVWTRLHSSRMHTTRLLTVSPSMHCAGGGCLLPGGGGGQLHFAGGNYTLESGHHILLVTLHDKQMIEILTLLQYC